MSLKSREFWIDAEIERPSVKVTNVWRLGETRKQEAIHVVEASALDAAKKENDRLKKEIQLLKEQLNGK